jgi:metallophosphoesterase (TIGR00282 family)
MKILICGDIVGKSGRDVLERFLPDLILENKLNFIIANGENSASGFGITKKICEQLYKIGVDVITSGNHIWDQKEIVSYIDNDKRLIRPCNYPLNTPGRGYCAYKIGNGNIISVINVMCRLFMDNIDDPFKKMDEIVEEIKMKHGSHTIIVDVHGESTSEKVALGHYLDGRVTAIFGTHTHIPTADLQILKKGSFYQTDLGMCGDYDSVIGMKKEQCIQRFTNKFIKSRLEPAIGQGTLCGTIIEVNQENKVVEFEQIFKGGKLDK